MCYYVTIGVRKRDTYLVEALGKERGGFNVTPSRNPSIARFFPAGQALYYITHGGCSCDLYATPTPTTPQEEETRSRDRYRRKGWSDAKIARALKSKRHTDRTTGDENYREKFCQTIMKLVHETGRLCLFAHQYDDLCDEEDFGRCAQLDLTLDAFTRDGGAFVPDTVVRLLSRAE